MTIPLKRREPGLGEFEETDKISIEHGGTNANSLLEAQDNLGISTKAEQADLTNLLNDVVDLTEEVATKADAAAVNQALSTKADLVDGVIPAAQLPSFVDDVLNGTYIDDETFNDENDDPYTPEDGKIYVDTTTNKTYRWSGSIYVEIGGGGVALGETSSTAYRGDRGKEAYDHSLSQGNPHNTTTSEITEGAKLFFTAERVRQTALDGFSAATATPITAADNVLQALGKAQGQINKAWSANWVNVETIGTLFSAIDAHNLQAAKIDGMLFFRGWFRNSTTAIQTTNQILDITDTSYHVQHDNVDVLQILTSTLLYWGTANGTLRFSINSSTNVQGINSASVLNAINSHRKIGSGLWCAGVLKNP
ncbi:hypothetical protein SDC64_07625 [Acinetobacter haemolyticus]|uniref:hypothetical protein n=1 Tax=Acinetobacter haemolyticus TaxID=29430 RepID=UPI002A6A777A|nr:hypothetical protein [Acinetobacter haemolyticus]WPO68779.1 hypothetical protein SDC64_07625 [Acinetobacter haemolyticus]